MVKAQEVKVPNFIQTELDSYITEALSLWEIPGIAISIVKDGKVIVNKGFGIRGLNQNVQVDQNTLFLIGSLTKAFTATAITKLAYEKGFSLDDPVQKWFPALQLSDSWISKNVTFQDFLSHRSGLSTYAGDFVIFDSDLTNKEYLEKIKYLPIKEDFRSFNYTNTGYFIIGEAIREMTGLSYSEYIEKNLFAPFGMSRSGAISSNWEKEENYASPHSLRNENIEVAKVGNADVMVASGGIYSSVNDLSKWLLVQLDEGRLNGKQVLESQVVSYVKTPRVMIGKTRGPYTMFNKSQYEHYSSGWNNLDYEGIELITHNGGMYGFSASITLIPEINLGVAILTNSDAHFLFEALKLEIVDAFLGLPLRNYSEIASRFYKMQQVNNQQAVKDFKASVKSLKTPTLLSKYEGEYANQAYGKVFVSANSNKLEIEFEHHSKLRGYLEYINENRFLCTYNDSVYGMEIIEFKTESDKISGLLLSVDPNVEPNQYEFKKER